MNTEIPREFKSIFTRLRAILRSQIGKLAVMENSPTRFCLGGGLHPTRGSAMPVAWVQIGKAYVSYHLMAVYVHPELLSGLSAPLKARMQGKSCFNFKATDEALFVELEGLTRKSLAAFRKDGYLP